MKKKLLILICILCMSSVAFGQVEKGDTEIQFMGYIASISDLTTGSIQVSIGYYFTPKLQIGIGPAVTIMSYTFIDYWGIELTETEVELSSTLFGTYNFSTSERLVPYVTATWYQLTYDIPELLDFTDFSFITAGGGLKYFLNENVAVNSSLMYGFSLGGGDGLLLLFSGLSVFL
jgi:hypothetical protein